MRVLFTRSNKIGSIAIRAFEGGQASHCGAVQPGRRVIDATWPHGVRIRSMEEFLNGREIVDDIALPVPDEAAAEQFLCAQLGRPYDLTFLISFLLWRDLNDPSRWACSELLLAAALAGGLSLADKHNRVGVRMLRVWAAAHGDSPSPILEGT